MLNRKKDSKKFIASKFYEKQFEGFERLNLICAQISVLLKQFLSDSVITSEIYDQKRESVQELEELKDALEVEVNKDRFIIPCEYINMYSDLGEMVEKKLCVHSDEYLRLSKDNSKEGKNSCERKRSELSDEVERFNSIWGKVSLKVMRYLNKTFVVC